ncbi:MAG TPA: hypothetical protein VMX75_08900, partial [Spirochaetia bacterium]|nr:hypothetical protein [Spirochaetia bacterium]
MKKKDPLLLGICPIGKFVFSHEDALRQKKAILQKLDTWGVNTCTIDGVIPDGIVRDQRHVEPVVEHFRRKKIDALFVPHCNFGTEGAVGMIGRRLGVPVLLWGPRDERPQPDGSRFRDTLCGMFASSKVLHKLHVPFTYVENSRVDDVRFKEGFSLFLRAASVVKAIRTMRIGQLGVRVDFFWTTIDNESELLELKGYRDLAADEAILDAEGTLGSLAMRDELFRLAEEENLDAFCIKSFNSIREALGPGLNLGDMLAQERYPIGAETDIHGAISSVLLEAASRVEEPSFFPEFTVRHPDNDNAVLLWHGAAPLSLRHPDMKKMRSFPPWILKDLPGAAFRMRLKDGPLTVCRFDGDTGEYVLGIGEGRTVPGPETREFYVWMKVDDWPRWYGALRTPQPKPLKLPVRRVHLLHGGDQQLFVFLLLSCVGQVPQLQVILRNVKELCLLPLGTDRPLRPGPDDREVRIGKERAELRLPVEHLAGDIMQPVYGAKRSGSQEIAVQRLVVRLCRRPEVSAAPIGHIDRLTEQAEERGLSFNRLAFLQYGFPAFAMNRIVKGDTEIIQQRGQEIGVLGKLGAALTGPYVSRGVHDEGNMSQLVPRMKPVLTRNTVLAQHVTMVRRKNDQGLIQNSLPLQLIQKPAEPPVHHREGGSVRFPQMLHCLRIVFPPLVFAPVIERPLPVVLIQIEELPGTVEGLMGIERLDPQKIVILALVQLQPVYGALESSGSRIITLRLEGAAVPGILGVPHAQVLRLFGNGDGPFAEVPLLAPVEPPGVEQGGVVFSAHMKVMVVVRFHAC